jgi:rhodanese-related sulfurtransferase
VTEISVQDLKAKHDAADDFVLLDVREPVELTQASIPWATAIPMRDVPQHLETLPTDKPIVVMCHHGGRSAQVTQFLNARGYANAVNLDGGIDAWSTTIDPTVPRY